jgi:upstream activation factor subunit UAF30
MPAAKTRVSSSVAPLQTAVPVQIVKSEIPAPTTFSESSPAAAPAAPAAPVKRTTAPKKKKATDTTTVVAPVVAVAATPVPVVPAVPAPVENEDLVEENAEKIEGEETTAPGDKKRTRRVATKDTLRADFDNLWTEYAEELSVKKKAGKKLSIEKYLHKLQADVYKLLKIRPLGDEKKPRGENNSGFMKPVNISPELANFIKVNSTEPITRVAITKKICEYIKEKDLQNPKDRREIIPDPSLKRIFSLTETEPEPLTYYSMQKKIQSHIFKV